MRPARAAGPSPDTEPGRHTVYGLPHAVKWESACRLASPAQPRSQGIKDPHLRAVQTHVDSPMTRFTRILTALLLAAACTPVQARDWERQVVPEIRGADLPRC